MVQGFTAGGPGLYTPGLGTKILQVADRVKKKKKKEVVLSLKIFPNQIPLPHTHTYTHTNYLAMVNLSCIMMWDLIS